MFVSKAAIVHLSGVTLERQLQTFSFDHIRNLPRKQVL